MRPAGPAPRLAAVLLLSIALLGCTPEKAQALRTAATQFKSEALAAVNVIELLMNKETEAPPRADTQAAAEFADNILGSTKPITDELIETALHPLAVAPDPALEEKRRQVLGDLRNQYSTFASIFDELEAGRLFARASVQRTRQHADNLAAQMAGFASVLAENPPKLLVYRGVLRKKMRDTRTAQDLSVEEKRRRMVALREEWLTLLASENDLQRSAVEQCLRAATVGVEVSRLIREYDSFSLQELSFFINQALETVGSLSGRNMDHLKIKTAELFAKLDEPENADLKALTNTALQKIKAGLSRANPAPEENP